MSGDSINSLFVGKEPPLNLKNLEYTKRLLDPFEDIVVERFEVSSSSSKRNVFVLAAVGLVLIINFPKIRHQSGMNEYLLWAVSAMLLLGVLY